MTDTTKELLGMYILIVLLSSFAYSYFESKSFFDSLWWSFVTAMTVGYGDSYPVSLGGRVIAILLMHVVPLFIIPLVTARLASKFIVNSDAFTHQEQEFIKKELAEIHREIKRKARNES